MTKVSENEVLSKSVDLESDVLDVSTQGFALIHAVLLTLSERKLLNQLVINHKNKVWEGFKFKITQKKLPFLKLGKKVWKVYDVEEIPNIYYHCGAQSLKSEESLNAWILSLSSGSKSLLELYQNPASTQMLGSLVERGGNVLKTLKKEK